MSNQCSCGERIDDYCLHPGPSKCLYFQHTFDAVCPSCPHNGLLHSDAKCCVAGCNCDFGSEVPYNRPRIFGTWGWRDRNGALFPWVPGNPNYKAQNTAGVVHQGAGGIIPEGVSQNKPVKKKCSCDLRSVIMVTGCKCGGV